MTTNNPDHQEDPPPYTPTPALAAGESTLERGPSATGWSRVQHHVLTNSSNASASNTTQPASLLRQLTNSLNNIVSQLNHPPRAHEQSPWPAYPGQHEASLRPNAVGPSSSTSPQPPPAASSSRSTSPFVHDFYSAGTGGGIIQSEFAPPPGPPPRQPESIPNPTPDNGTPTPYPVIGHPLLNDGKVLVYPKGFKCHKCDNIGYKEADPSRPCRRCWDKYARPFSGPLAYSFSSNSNDGNFQRPLPPPVYQTPNTFEPPGGFQSHFQPQPTGFGAPPRIVQEAPPTNAVVYTAGDPRIGGALCWSCGGKGHVSLLFLDSMNCTVCNGVGRIF